MTEVNFVQVIPDSHWFTNLEQIQYYAENNGDEYLAIGIRNSINKGYEMVQKETTNANTDRT